MGAFAEKAKKAAAASKATTMEGKKDLKKEDNTGIDIEGKSRFQMPNLPRPLTTEEKKYLLAVERGDSSTVKKLLQKCARSPNYMNRNCVDPMGRGALHMAIDNENLEMVELLVVMGVETRDSLLHAIDVEFVEAVEVLLEHEEVIHKDGQPYSWEKIDRNTASFTPEITPLILAAHRDNYEILKILLDRGAALPMPHDIRCGCDECIKSSSDDSLRHSMSRINSYKALASPSLIALSSTDPILTAFELSDELKSLAYEENEFSREYLELRAQCRAFAEELLSYTRTSTELAVILNYDPESQPYEDGDSMKLKRLELAIDYKQKSFVAHPNVQQLLAALWYAGLPGFRRLPLSERLVQLVKVVVLFPAYCVHYMLLPDSPRGKIIKSPFMKFLLHSASYLFFLMMLILFSVRFEELFVMFLGTESMRHNLLESLKKQRGNLPTPIECIILLYVVAFVWQEIKEIKKDGPKKYFRNMWNMLDVMRDSLYVSTVFLRIFAYVQQITEISENPQTAFIPREEWDSFDPQLVSEGLFSAANILSALKLVHIFSINPYLGPLQISLGRMVIDIVKFFFIYTLVLFAFACGLTQLLWYFNDLERQKCYSLPGGLPNWSKNGEACVKWRRFYNLFEASQSLFWAGFGMVGLDDFELTGVGGYTRFWSMLMFGAYSVINLIVLLNLLIAMMSNSYAFIVDHADTEWKFARSKLWMSYFEDGSTIPPPFNIIPSVKSFKRIFSAKEKKLLRKMSSRTMGNARKARDYRYLSVMRALIWRYVCSNQQKSIDRPVTEDDINEVKGDISSLRFELIDLFENNGMDISQCEKKSKAALGRKMKMWERRLMRDFHVSPAMGSDDTEESTDTIPTSVNTDEAGADRFRRIAKLAMITKSVDVAEGAGPQLGGNQIGRTNLTDESEKNKLKAAMEKTRLKLEEGSPGGSPNSSRGCSPFPDLYTGPNLMETIQSLDLSRQNTPSPASSTQNTNAWSCQMKNSDAQAKDFTKLTIPGRRSESTLKSKDEAGRTELVVPEKMSTVSKSVAGGTDVLVSKIATQNNSTVDNKISVVNKPTAPIKNMVPGNAMKIPPPQNMQPRRNRTSQAIPHTTNVQELETMDVVRRPKISARKLSHVNLIEKNETVNTPIMKPELLFQADARKIGISIAENKSAAASYASVAQTNITSVFSTERTSLFDVKKTDSPPEITVIPSTPAPPEIPREETKVSDKILTHSNENKVTEDIIVRKPKTNQESTNNKQDFTESKASRAVPPTSLDKTEEKPKAAAPKKPAPAAPTQVKSEGAEESKALPTEVKCVTPPKNVSPTSNMAGWI